MLCTYICAHCTCVICMYVCKYIPQFVSLLCLNSLDLRFEAVELSVQLVLGHLQSAQFLLHVVLMVPLLVEPPPQQIIVLNQPLVVVCVCTHVCCAYVCMYIHMWCLCVLCIMCVCLVYMCVYLYVCLCMYSTCMTVCVCGSQLFLLFCTALMSLLILLHSLLHHADHL